MAKPIPEGYHTVTPYLIVKGAARALEFYKKAFNATELFRLEGPGGTIGHAEFQIGDSRIMLADEFPDMGARGPETIGGSPVGLCIYTEDVDALFKQALVDKTDDPSTVLPLAGYVRAGVSSYYSAYVRC